jgi:hypothetical protein
MIDELSARLVQPGVFDSEPAQDAQSREAWAKGYEIAKLHADVFNTEAGQKLMLYWIKVFVARAIVRPGDDQFSAGIREGQADVVRQALKQLEYARQGPPGG